MILTIDTDFPETNCKTVLHLVELDENLQFRNYLEGSEERGFSGIKTALKPGYYNVVVESANGQTQGDFELSIGMSNLLLTRQ